MLSRDDLQKIRLFIYRNARPLDLYRWQYHFENGEQESVLVVLASYQNTDGGFGHALEADAWNPYSSPIQTSTAAQLLMETGFWEKNHPLPFGMLQYLDNGRDMEDSRWNTVIPSNDDHPHAPWWRTGSKSTSHSQFNPSAILAGFALYFAPRNSMLFGRCKKMAGEMAKAFLDAPELDLHPLLCVETMVEYMIKAGMQDTFPTAAMEKEILKQASHLIQNDSHKWSGYACRPSAFLHSPEHPLYGELKVLAEKELDWILSTRNEQGVWDITWQWDGYEKAFAISENWWKADIAIRNLRHLKAFGRIETAFTGR